MPRIEQATIEQALDSWAAHIASTLREHPDCRPAIVGLISHGDVLARRLVQRLGQTGIQAEYGALDITLYRDDLDLRKARPALRSSYLPFSPDDTCLILVDDVVNTGRTVRAALEAIFEYGRPSIVELHCLVDRGGRELPIQPNYSAFTLSADAAASVSVHLAEIDGDEGILY